MELPGNVTTRVEKAAQFDAAVVAYAALERLDLSDHAAEVLPVSVMLPMVAQGALAVECRVGDDDARALLASIDDAGVHRAVDAERGFLAELGGGCTMPCGAYATVTGDTIALDAMLAVPDGTRVLRHSATGTDAPGLGRAVARTIIDDLGGTALLTEVTR